MYRHSLKDLLDSIGATNAVRSWPHKQLLSQNMFLG